MIAFILYLVPSIVVALVLFLRSHKADHDAEGY